MYGPGAIVDKKTGSIGGKVSNTYNWMRLPHGEKARQEYEDLIYDIVYRVTTDNEDQHNIAVWLENHYTKILQKIEVSCTEHGTVKKYYNSEYNFSITYSKDWSLKVLEPNPEVDVNLNIYLGDIQGNVVCNIMAGPIGYTIFGKTIKELKKRAGINRQWLNATLVSSKILMIGGMDAYEHVYIAENPHRYVKQVGFFTDDDEYLLLFKVFSKDDFEKYKSVFDELLRSFRFTNKTPKQDLKEYVLNNKENNSSDIINIKNDIYFYDKILEIFPRNISAWNNRGRRLHSLG